jgi:hypothetical protein
MESIRNIAKQLWLIKLYITVSYFVTTKTQVTILDNNDLGRGITITSKKCFGEHAKERKSTLLILLVTPISVVK